MTDTLLYKKNKRIGFRLLLFMFLGLLAIVAVLPFSLASEDTQAEEKKLSTIFPNIYATLMDQNGKIVSTTDPNKEIDDLYKYTDNNSPSEFLTNDDKLYLVIDATVETNQNEKINVLENVYYNLDLPTQIIPDDSLIVHGRDDELELLKLGKTQAFGGIYVDDNNNYRLKVRFNDIDDIYQLKLSYKILFSFNDSIFEQISDLKKLTINDIGNLNFYLKSIEKSKYKLTQTLDNNYNSEDLYDLTTTLVDTRDGDNQITKGRLFIDLGTDFGFSSYSKYNNIQSKSYLNSIRVYVNGEMLSPLLNEYGGPIGVFESQYINDNVKITIKSLEHNQNIFVSGYSYLVNRFEVIIENNEGGNAIGINEIKIVIPEKVTTTKLGDHSNSASYEDYLDNNKIINTAVDVNDESSNIKISTSIEKEKYAADRYIPSELTYNIDISKSPSNFVKIDIDNELLNLDVNTFQYFINAGCINQGAYPSCVTPTIFIDDTKVNFLTGIQIDHFRSLTSGQIQPPDGPALLQMKEILGDEINNFGSTINTSLPYNNSILRSETVNADGEYYYILWSYETYDTANKSLKMGRGEYANFTAQKKDSAFEFKGTPKVTMYLFNISNKKIRLSFDYLLSQITRTEINNQNSGKYLSLTTNVINDYNYYNNSRVSDKVEKSTNYNKYMTVNGEAFANNFIKWNVVIDAREINLYNDSGYYNMIYVNLPSTQTFDRNSVYLINEDRIDNKVPQNGKAYRDYLQMYPIHIGKYNPVTKKCDNLFTTFSSWTTINSYKEDSLFANSLDDVYAATGFNDIFKNNIYNDKVCLVFFTKSDLTSGDDKVKVEFNLINGGRFHIGQPTVAIKYEAEGAINRTDKGSKSIELIDDENDIIKWKYVADLTSDKDICYDQSGDGSLPFMCTCNKAYYNGMFTFSDSMYNGVADYTYLDKIDVHIKGHTSNTTISMNKDEFVDIENKKCNSDGVCINVTFYPTYYCRFSSRNEECIIANYGTNYLSKLKKMSNGFALLVTGINDGESITVDYDTWSDSQEFINNYNGPLSQSGYTTTNTIVRNNWQDTKYNVSTNASDFISQVSFSKRMNASLSIEKIMPGVSSKKYITNDSIKNIKVNVVSGYSPVEYLKIVDRITGVRNVELLNDENTLTNLRDNLIIENLLIKYKDNFGNEEIVYQNGQFTNEWSNSTIKLNSSDLSYNSDDKSINLYSLYLKNNNHLLDSLSNINISYDLILDMDNYSDENGTSYRNSDSYSNKTIQLITDAYAVRPYGSDDIDNNSVLSSNNRNYVDYENNELYCFTSGAASSAIYLNNPAVTKSVVTNFDSILNTFKNSYQINYYSYSSGKEDRPKYNLEDLMFVDFALSGSNATTENNQKVNRLNEILLEKTKIINFKIYDKNNNVVYEKDEIDVDINDEPFNNENINGSFSVNKTTNTIPKGIFISILGDLGKYDDTFKIRYDTETYLISFMQAAMEEDLIDINYIITGTNIQYQPRFKNSVKNSLFEGNESTVQSGYISLKALSPIVKKTVSYPSSLEQTWTLKTNTGYTDSPINIEDIMTVLPVDITDLTSVNGNNDIAQSIVVDNLIIKINNEIVYENNEFKDGYQDAISINIDKLNLDFTFKNSDIADILGHGYDIEIIYNTKFDPQKYYDLTGKNNASYSIKNNAMIERDNLIGSNTATSKNITYEYPLEVNKFNENREENSTSTFWKIEISSPNITKKNITVNDSVTLSDSFKDYLSLANMVITLVDENEEVLFDYKNGINKLSNSYVLKDKLVSELEFNKNGECEFIFGIDELKANNKIVIEYEIKIDTDKYRNDNKPTDVLLQIFNNLRVLSGNEEYEVNKTGNNIVDSILYKKYRILSVNDGIALINWTVDINLDVDYDGKIKEDDIVEIKDELYASLKYVDNSLEVYRKVFNGTDYSKTKLQKDVDYNFEYVDNTIKVRILNPVENSNILIEFNTDAVSTEGLKNYVTLSVKNEEIHANTEEVVPLFLKYIGGIVTSRQSKFYTIYANKYLDNELSSTIFKFKLEEVDYEGNILDDGLKLTVQNDQEGKITFGPIIYSKTGTYYYKISEINENKDFIYDQSNYMLKIKVAEYNNSYVIEKVEILNYEGEEINFYNKTIEKDPIVEPQNPIEPDEPDNPIESDKPDPVEPNKPHTEEIQNIPKTNDNIIYSFIAFFISIGVFIYLLVYLSKNKKKTI